MIIYYQSSPSWWILKALCENEGYEEIGKVKDYVIKEIGGNEKDILKRIKRLIKSEHIEITYEVMGEKLWGNGTRLQIKKSGQLIYTTNKQIADGLIKSIEKIFTKDQIVFSCRSDKIDILNWSGSIYYSINNQIKETMLMYMTLNTLNKSLEEYVSQCSYNLLPLVGRSRHRNSGHWTHDFFVIEFEKRCKETSSGKGFFAKMKKEIATKTLICIFGKELSLKQDNLDVLLAHEHPVIRIMSKALINQNKEVYV